MAATKFRLYRDALRIIADVRLAVITDDIESRYALDDAWDEAVAFVLRQADWRFALTTSTLVTMVSVPVAGYAYAFDRPATWMRTHAIFTVGTDGREYPLDLRDSQAAISTNTLGAVIRYVSSLFADPELANNPWPEHFAQTVAAYLAFLVADRVTGEAGSSSRISQLFSQLLDEAISIDAAPPDRWLPHQRNGEMLLGARDFLSRADWRFALVDATIAVESGVPPDGMTHSFAQPDDWLRTHKLFVATDDGRECPFDIREQGGFWSNNAGAFQARYVSKARGLDPTKWDAPFRTALLDYLEAGRPAIPDKADGQAAAPQWQRSFVLAVATSSEPPDPLLPHQFSGALHRAALLVLREGFWRFAMKTVGATSGAVPAPGYAYAFEIGGDWIRTHALFIADSGRQLPFDVREQSGAWHANVATFSVRYVSTQRGIDSRLWPEPFVAAVQAFLADGEVAQGGQKPEPAYPAALAAALAVEADGSDPWLAHQLDGRFQRVAPTLVDEGFWRFALTTAALTTVVGGGASGYARQVAVPDDWSHTRRLYRLSADGRRMPFEVYEHDGLWLTDATDFNAEYVSKTLAMDVTRWSDHYLRAVLRAVEFDAAASAGAQREQVDGAAAKDALLAALDGEAEPDDPWLRHQFSGTFERGRRFVLQQGNWVYRDPAGVMRGLKERQYSSLDDQSADQPSYPFPYRYPLPTDWFKTHALFVPWDGQECPINIRETAQDWSSDAESFVARYIATDVLDATTWPEAIGRAVLAYCDWQASTPQEAGARADEYVALLNEARKAHSREDDDWLRFQLDGTFEAGKRQLLEEGRWRFAVKSPVLTASADPLPAEESDGTASTPYAYRFILPNDWIRTVTVYSVLGTAPFADRREIDFRDEQGALHANYSPIVLRYVSRLGLDSTKWPALFRDALLARLQYMEARGDPAKAVIAKIKYEAYEEACRKAEQMDDSRDMPVVRGSRIIAARFGAGRSSRSRELGWWGPV